MKTLILPGFSLGNKKWAEELGILDKEIWYWPHWESGNEADFVAEVQAEKIINVLTDPVYIIAKSVGTLVTMMILKSKAILVSKLILNGIPLIGLLDKQEARNLYIAGLSKYETEKLMVIQNQSDPWGSYYDVKNFLKQINPNVNIISKPREDHSYPYSDEFIKFLL